MDNGVMYDPILTGMEIRDVNMESIQAEIKD